MRRPVAARLVRDGRDQVEDPAGQAAPRDRSYHPLRFHAAAAPQEAHALLWAPWLRQLAHLLELAQGVFLDACPGAPLLRAAANQRLSLPGPVNKRKLRE